MTRSLTVIGQGVVAVAGGEEAEPGRVEQRPAVGRQPDVLERRAPVQRLGRGEQPVPGQVGAVQGLGTLVAGTLVERVELVADAVPAGEQLALREQAAFLGEQQEHHPHHHRDGGLVDLVPVGGQRVRLAAAPRAERGFRQRLHEQFDRPADVRAERLGDLLGGGDGVAEQLGEQVLLPVAGQAGQAEQLQERVADGGQFDPPLGVGDAGGDHRLGAGADDRPPAPVGDDTDPDSGLPQQFLHPVDRAGGPAVVSGSRSDSTGSVTSTSAPVVSPRDSAPVGLTVTA